MKKGRSFIIKRQEKRCLKETKEQEWSGKENFKMYFQDGAEETWEKTS